MPNARHPTLFVSHGPPTLALAESPARRFLIEMGSSLARPEAILCVSAHWETEVPTVATTARPRTIHDFYGFPDDLYKVRYAAPGAPDLAKEVTRRLKKAKIPCNQDTERGLDHGAWVPLMLMFPDADVPVTQLSVQPRATAADHLRLGRALAGLGDEGVLVLASGGAVHNLAHFDPGGRLVPEWAQRFEEWLDKVLTAGRGEELVETWTRTADGAQAHPRDEHLLPLPVALGAAGEGARGRALHRGFMDGALGMAAYAFERA